VRAAIRSTNQPDQNGHRANVAAHPDHIRRAHEQTSLTRANRSSIRTNAPSSKPLNARCPSPSVRLELQRRRIVPLLRNDQMPDRFRAQRERSARHSSNISSSLLGILTRLNWRRQSFPTYSNFCSKSPRGIQQGRIVPDHSGSSRSGCRGKPARPSNGSAPTAGTDTGSRSALSIHASSQAHVPSETLGYLCMFPVSALRQPSVVYPGLATSTSSE